MYPVRGDPRRAASIFTLLTPSEEELLESVTEPVFSAFLTAALQAFALNEALMPIVASGVVAALTTLFELLQVSAEQIQSFEETAEYRGWEFPLLTYVPKGYVRGAFTYYEELWSRPRAVQSFQRGSRRITVSMERVSSDPGPTEFEVLGAHEVERSDDLTILARGANGISIPGVQATIGPWTVRISSLDCVSQKTILKMARGLQLPDAAGSRRSGHT